MKIAAPFSELQTAELAEEDAKSTNIAISVHYQQQHTPVSILQDKLHTHQCGRSSAWPFPRTFPV